MVSCGLAVANQGDSHAAALQIACFTEPEKRQGTVLPKALLRRLPIAVRSTRTGAWRELWPLVLQSLYCGEIVVMHCMHGRHRAAGAAALTRAIMIDESFDTAAAWIAERRNIDIQGLRRNKELEKWLKVTAGNTQRSDRWPRPTGFLEMEQGNLHVQGFKAIPLCMHHQSDEATAHFPDPMFTDSWAEAEAWMRPWCHGCVVSRGCPEMLVQNEPLWARLGREPEARRPYLFVD